MRCLNKHCCCLAVEDTASSVFHCTATDHASTDTTTVCCMLTLSGALLGGPQKMVGESQCPVSKHVMYGSPPFTTHPGARHVATHRDSNSVPCNTYSLATHRDSNSVPCNTYSQATHRDSNSVPCKTQRPGYTSGLELCTQ